MDKITNYSEYTEQLILTQFKGGGSEDPIPTFGNIQAVTDDTAVFIWQAVTDDDAELIVQGVTEDF